ncbi:hypothetical protein BDR05DRAFT_52109 [Suillus weaverae]|nr:hypothetical protein BDR05DRAFT_52109 [Suillus weaverae]
MVNFSFWFIHSPRARFTCCAATLCMYVSFPISLCLLTLSSLLHPPASSKTFLRPFAPSRTFPPCFRAFSYRLTPSPIVVISAVWLLFLSSLPVQLTLPSLCHFEYLPLAYVYLYLLYFRAHCL